MSTVKRDFLHTIESTIRPLWDAEHLFESDPPPPQSTNENTKNKKKKFMATFPFPYMNGKLHLGHTFSLSKCEFAVGYHMMKGEDCLFPFGFHATGMPIKACADKLNNEIQKFGYPPQFPEATAETEDASKPAQHSKVAAKTGNVKYQWQIMQSLGFTDEEILPFKDPIYWLRTLPPMAKRDLINFGLKVDWRRSFITTDLNPYYDSFVRWTFNKLRRLNKIQYGERYTIYSPLDQQACMDHDRSSGEGNKPLEYTAIKIKLMLPLPAGLEELYGKLEGQDAFLVAATLRPETMYGQTNVFVGPHIDYVAWKGEKDVYITTEQAARNCSYQGITKERGTVEVLQKFKGSLLVGHKVVAPLTSHPYVHLLPMDQILPKKGTGIVTSVPSDSPDDYVMLTTLQKKFAYYNIQEEWVKGFDPVPVIKTEKYGELSAEKWCTENKCTSPKEKDLLALGKKECYRESYHSGVMLVGEFKGLPVPEAKIKCRDAMIRDHQAFPFYEPEGEVVSRSGDICVVAPLAQWYIDYGEPSWKALAEKCLNKMETYHNETRNSFQATLDWFKQWACSRSFGLGTKIPWDQQYLIESLSDSTVYMAYYCVAHMLQGGVINGDQVGPSGIKADQMTDEVWEYIFGEGAMPTTNIDIGTLNEMREQFNYYYPFDVRCSGKDLIPNHLTMSIYTHTALFPENKWPKGMRANGHLLIDGKKMSKSEGNFMTIEDSIREYSADATRLALANAGDGIDDANFATDVSNQSVLRLFTLHEWIKDSIAEQKAGKYRNADEPYNFSDRLFEAEMSKYLDMTTEDYEKTLYREAVTHGFHEFCNQRDRYLVACNSVLAPLHSKLINLWIETQLRILAPITPHFSEYCWRYCLSNTSTILKGPWPVLKKSDEAVLAAGSYIDSQLRAFRLAKDPPKKKKKTPNAPAPVYTSATIYCASEYPTWQNDICRELKPLYDSKSDTFPILGEAQNDYKALMTHFSKEPFASYAKGKYAKRFMPFINLIISSKSFDRAALFNERQVLEDNCDYLAANLSLEKLAIVDYHYNPAEEDTTKVAEPFAPTIKFG